MTDPFEDELLAELGEVLRERAGPPPELTAAAKEIFTWRTVDAELAALTYDSLLDEVGATVRSSIEPLRQLTFEADGLAIELEIEPDGGRHRVTGQLVPPGPAQVELRTGADVVLVPADDLGRFAVTVLRGRARLRLRVMLPGRTVSAAVVL